MRTKGNYEQWVKFFLRALNESAQDAMQAINELSVLHDKNEAAINKIGRSRKNVLRVFEYLEARPIIDIGKTSAKLGIAIYFWLVLLVSLNVVVTTVFRRQNAFRMECQSTPCFLAAIECVLMPYGGTGG